MENKNSVVKGILVVIGGLAFVAVGAWISNLIKGNYDKPNPNGGSRPLVTCPADFPAYAKLIENPNRTVKLIDSRKSMFAENGEFVNSQIIITKNETKESKVACGYLFVRSGTEAGPLKSWENLYINPNEFGGHINHEGQVGPGDGNNFSEYLFPLNEIKYWKTRSERSQGVLSTADWAALLNVSEKVSFDIALNTENKTGFIDELSIAYKCWNPETGEENEGCKLSITWRSDTQSENLR